MFVLGWSVRRGWLGILAAGSGLTLAMQARTADACTCVPSSVERSYGSSSDVVSAVPWLNVLVGSERRYLAHVTGTYKGCAKPGRLVMLSTPGSSAACGAELELGTEYLINGERNGSIFGVPKLGVTLCGHNLPLDSLSEAEREFLDGRSVCCGDDCSCANGSRPVQCFANPCDVTPACEEAARCEANYCGGCNAEFYDATGAAVCQADPASECNGDGDCVQTGCSGQVCAARDVITTCEFREEFACFQDPAITRCGCEAGRCAFAATPELDACLEAAGASGG